MSPTHLNLDKARRVSFTLGAGIAVAFFLAGAGVTWGTMRTDLSEVRTTSKDHESRIRKVEEILSDKVGRLETKVDELLRRTP